MSEFKVVIRDAVVTDIPNCLNLDHTYETNYVWQMTVQEGSDGYGVTFRRERLPRSMEVDYVVPEKRLNTAIREKDCFLIASAKDEPETYGYLVMRQDTIHKIALVQALVVSHPYRRKKIATRLLNVACHWADEHNLVQLTTETQTKNYPSIEFFQQYGLAFCGFNDQYFRNQDIAVFFGQTLR